MFSSRKSLKSQKKCMVSLVKSPDGIPWGISIYRGKSPNEYIQPIAVSLGYDPLPEKWGTKFEELACSVQKIIDDRQFFQLEHKNKNHEFYILSCNMKQLFGKTILRRMIDKFEDTKSDTYCRDSSIEDSRSYHLDEENSPQAQIIQKKIEERLHASSPKLAIQTDGNKLGIIRLRQDRSVLWERYFISEDLTHLKTGKFYAYVANNIIAEGSLGKKYLELRKPGVFNNYQWKFKVKVSEILHHLAELTFSLHESHQKGIVHADLKPENILITKKGMIAIDSMEAMIGKNSKGMTKRYAAPEQIMRETVSPQTDQYAFGVILAELLGGVIYGEEVNFIIPTGGSGSTRMTILKDPGVFLDPTTCSVPTKSIQRVRDLIKKCLSFHCSDRFSSMKEIGTEIHSWNKDDDFSHELECPLQFGQLKSDETENSYWWLTDNYQ
ncbi:protein kinase domain-containing protein [Candidatus Uabimicrobium amorphum]|uniref:Serine/threonine protein kinase n=1 Tax=Uabimicrobium amorphum TaxID=2596890 RepID=A0A5S9IRC9_UABAM|nr:protein kinase [Candidatus Uabimicrobium amorphum]BBM86032.1 serine/threonine protein kinase [Candidatus Uabimicrobium amorphum]